MDLSYQSLHRLPILNYDNVSQNTKRKDFKSIHGNNVRDCTNNIRNIQKNEPENEKTDGTVKNSKTKSRRKPVSQKHLKETFSICTGYVKRLIQNRNSAKSSRKHANHKTSSRQAKQIKVLYLSESQNVTNKRRNINQDLIDDIYRFNANDYGTVKDVRNNTSENNVKNRQSGHRVEVPKQKRHQIRKVYTVNTATSATCGDKYKPTPNPSYSRDKPPHYKVVQFPDYDQTDTELEAIYMGKNCEFDNFEYQSRKDVDLQKEQLDPVKPRVSNGQRGAGDASNVSIQYSDPKKDCIKHEKANNDDFERFLDPIDMQQNIICLAKTTLKYLIFGLALLVWSPCIITLYCCWLVTYQLQPKYSSTSAARNSRCRRSSQAEVHVRGSKHVINNSMQTCRNNPWSHLIQGVSWAYQPLAMSFGAFKTLLNPNTNDLHCHLSSINGRSGNKNRVMTSDRGKKYTLYYSKSKGWVMKSRKRRPRKTNNIPCNIKEVPKTVNERHYKEIDEGYTIDAKSRYPQHSCQVHAGKYEIEKNKKNCLPNYSRSRHKHLCKDSSGLPVHIKLLNPMFNNNMSKRHNVRLVDKKHQSMLQRQLRYPDQHYKKRSRCKGLIKRESKSKLKHRITHYCKELKNNIKTLIDNVEMEVFGDNAGCKGLYIQSLRRTPWYSVFKYCPTFYPAFLSIYRFYENMCHFFLLVFTACVWCPVLAFCYLSYIIICRSL